MDLINLLTKISRLYSNLSQSWEKEFVLQKGSSHSRWLSLTLLHICPPVTAGKKARSKLTSTSVLLYRIVFEFIFLAKSDLITTEPYTWCAHAWHAHANYYRNVFVDSWWTDNTDSQNQLPTSHPPFCAWSFSFFLTYPRNLTESLELWYKSSPVSFWTYFSSKQTCFEKGTACSQLSYRVP